MSHDTRQVWSVHSELGVTGNFRVTSQGLLVEVECLNVKTTQERLTYTSYRRAAPDDLEAARLQSLRRVHLKESLQ